MAKDTYFEITYNGPFRGVDVSMPENMIESKASPFMRNFILKNGEIRSRPRKYFVIPGPPDGSLMNNINTFLDANNVFHTVTVTNTGLWQLNRGWQNNYASTNPIIRSKVWSRVAVFPSQPGPALPLAAMSFVNKFYWTNGGANTWVWDGINSINALAPWQPSKQYYVGNQIVDSNGNWQICIQAGISNNAGTGHPAWSMTIGGQTNDGTGTGQAQLQWIENGKPFLQNGGIQNTCIVNAALGTTAGAFFMGELGASLILLNTVESVGGNFTQRMRYSPSGIPNIFDPNVNIAAGFNDFLDCPDQITGALFIGTTAFVIRTNGVTEVSIGGSGTNPFSYNHLWASQQGIGNVFPFSVAAYGPIGVMISTEEIYEVSIGGFKEIGGVALDAIMQDLNARTGTPIASITPIYNPSYVYMQYQLIIPQGNNSSVWRYSFKDKSWQNDFYSNTIYTGYPCYCAVA